MTAGYADSRRYALPRDLIFRACFDAMQPCGLVITSSIQESWTIHAISTDGNFAKQENSSIMGLLFRGINSKFRERITVSVDETGLVAVSSTSTPKTVVLDYGRNLAHVIDIWRKLDEYLLRDRGVVMNVNDHSVVITGNSGSVQQGSPGAQQQSASPGATQVTGDADDLPRVRAFIREFNEHAHELQLPSELEAEIRAEIATIHAQSESPKPKRHVIRESLRSVRSILEQAGGGVAAAALLEIIRHIS
jgi:hypothetical protein